MTAGARPTRTSAKDPVCGMTVDPATAKHKAEHGGATYYFCSAGCRDKFVAEPARYLGAEAGERRRRSHAPAGRRSTPARCIRRSGRPGPGHCPICGMALEPEVAAAATGPERGARRHDAALLDRARARRPRRSRSRWAGICIGLHALLARRRLQLDPARRWRRRSCCGRAGRSSCAAGRRSGRATSTCSR